ncbi:hypothetical protein JWG42_12350 [Desulfoprunum benzoelyticum]|uniref:Uncharacterized protein n=1 Tax=Desulfoprunum benzoelyticum TaxID=1506996 RepID=A0A840V0N3_9BACT|nr:hypothetical protein [Desulfoprunum benzoelyticum]MBB5347380.1 hypothetical protein [Desulfoprunum benzoelyticum]MBM9530942.1 hypothetical protein [Desulfoprunum benzoelyticum]
MFTRLEVFRPGRDPRRFRQEMAASADAAGGSRATTEAVSVTLPLFAAQFN